jgi:hypothetical protein
MSTARLEIQLCQKLVLVLSDLPLDRPGTSDTKFQDILTNGWPGKLKIIHWCAWSQMLQPNFGGLSAYSLYSYNRSLGIILQDSKKKRYSIKWRGNPPAKQRQCPLLPWSNLYVYTPYPTVSLPELVCMLHAYCDSSGTIYISVTNKLCLKNPRTAIYCHPGRAPVGW